MKKSIKWLFISIMLITINLCISCSTDHKKRYFNDFKTSNNIEHLEYDDLEYCYRYTSGLDSAGINYFVFKFDEKPNDFLNQFNSPNFGLAERHVFENDRNVDYEKEVMDKIDIFIGEKYNDITDKYKLDFSKKYIHNKYPMFYFSESNELYIIQFLQ